MSTLIRAVKDTAVSLCSRFSSRAVSCLVFYTYTPWAYPIGSVHNGYRVTQVERTSPTALMGGGNAGCWEVWGVAVDQQK
jgi:hypothetical protein